MVHEKSSNSCCNILNQKAYCKPPWDTEMSADIHLCVYHIIVLIMLYVYRTLGCIKTVFRVTISRIFSLWNCDAILIHPLYKYMRNICACAYRNVRKAYVQGQVYLQEVFYFRTAIIFHSFSATARVSRYVQTVRFNAFFRTWIGKNISWKNYRDRLTTTEWSIPSYIELCAPPKGVMLWWSWSSLKSSDPFRDLAGLIRARVGVTSLHRVVSSFDSEQRWPESVY